MKDRHKALDVFNAIDKDGITGKLVATGASS